MMASISTSEIRSFKRCRRKWDLDSPNRRGLVLNGPAHEALTIGGLVHHGLHIARTAGEPTLKVREEGARRLAKMALNIDDEQHQKFWDCVELAVSLVSHYSAHYGEDSLPDNWRYAASELTFKVPIPGTVGYFTGTFDGLALDEDEKLWIVDHKTYTTQPDSQDLIMDEQFIGYTWAASKIFPGQESVRGVLYDGIAKRVPEKPKITKLGKVSKRKVLTTKKLYLEAIKDIGGDPAEYQDILEWLDTAQEAGFFLRRKLYYGANVLRQWELDLKKTYWDMTQAPRIYPNFRREGCWDCQFRSGLCPAIQSREDAQWLIANEYRKREEGDYQTADHLKKADIRKMRSVKDLLSLNLLEV